MTFKQYFIFVKGDLELVRHLLLYGASANTQDNAGWTPLHEAVQGGHVEVAKLLLQEGRVDPNVPGSDENVTPLHEACAAGHRGLIKLLVAHGADKRAVDAKGQTARDAACDNAARACLDAARCTLTDSEQLDVSAAAAASAAAAELQRSRVLFLPDLPQSEAAAARTATKRMGVKVEAALGPDVTTAVFFGLAREDKGGKRLSSTDAAGTTLLEKETPEYYEALMSGKWIVGRECK